MCGVWFDACSLHVRTLRGTFRYAEQATRDALGEQVGVLK